jgi:hypothetical protein
VHGCDQGSGPPRLVSGARVRLPCVYAIWYFVDRGQIWTFLGYPTYGEGLFENVGIKTSVPLLVSFLLVCVAELVVGWMLWWSRRPGLVFALALLPIELLFWVGFLLPVGPPLGLLRTILVLMAWSWGRSQRPAWPLALGRCLNPADPGLGSKRPALCRTSRTHGC